MTRREQLIEQLRQALGQLERPDCDVAEFELGDTNFCFETLDSNLSFQELV
jgi:hypothetical protein